MTNVRFGPFNAAFDLQRELNKIFDSVSPRCDVDVKVDAGMWRPAVDVHEDENSYLIEAELPGIAREDVKINFQNGALTISGERRYVHEQKTEENENPEATGKQFKNRNRVERFYGRFSRSFKLPAMVNPENITARFENGVLIVTVPKAEVVKPREIEIG